MATTINSYSVSLAMNADGFIDKTRISRSEARQLTQSIEAARSPAERYQNAIDKLTSAKAAGAIQTGVFIRLMDEEERKFKSATSSAKSHESGISGIATQLKGLAAGYVGLQTVTKSIKLAIDAEQANAQFEVLTGSLDKARALIGQIKTFAAESPVSLSGARDAAKTMLAFNIPLQEVNKNLRMLGDISGGNQQRFDMLTLSFSQMSAAGRLMGQDLLQMVNAGFNPLQEISAKTGESMMALKKRMEDGRISSQEVRDAFLSATEAGGRFHGMTERMAETMGGKLAIASAQLEESLAKVGTAMAPLVISLTDGMKDGTSAIDEGANAVGVLSDGLAYAVAMAKDLTRSGGQIASVFGFGDGDSLQNVNKFFDLLDKRKAESEAGKTNVEKLMDRSFFGPTDAQLALAKRRDAEDAAVRKNMEAAEAAKEDEKRMLSMMDAADQVAEHADQLEKAETAKRLEAEKKIADEAWNKMYDRVLEEEQKRIDMERKIAGEAIKAAEDQFKKERDNQRKLRDDIAKGPMSIESGSAEAQKFMADQANAAIAASVAPDMPAPTEEQMLVEIQKQLAIMEATKVTQDKLLAATEKLLEKKPEVAKFR
jgi:tape measure domain-containing protein